jgi:hypothetical protein
MSMTLKAVRTALLENSAKNVRLVLPDGDLVAADFHVTEVGHVVKNFVDCGGTRRRAESVVLQAWVAANDPDHRLTGAKLAAILDLAKTILPSDELNVEVEYEGCAISQYPVMGATTEGNEVRFALAEKHTDCLAREACGLESCGCGPQDDQAAAKCC